jgi:RimJ/RimL family protein N-acetyltransferase
LLSARVRNGASASMLAPVTMSPVPDRAELNAVAETERVVVRLWHPVDADRLLDIHSRSEVMKWLGQIPMSNREEALERIEEWNVTAAPNLGFGMWAVVERDCSVPAGTVFMQVLPDGAGEVEIGWYLHPDSWGRGLASDAASALLVRGFASGLDEIWALPAPDNDRSIAVCHRIGMQLLGLTDRWWHEPHLMFWAGAHPGQQPSVSPDAPAA